MASSEPNRRPDQPRGQHTSTPRELNVAPERRTQNQTAHYQGSCARQAYHYTNITLLHSHFPPEGVTSIKAMQSHRRGNREPKQPWLGDSIIHKSTRQRTRASRIRNPHAAGDGALTCEVQHGLNDREPTGRLFTWVLLGTLSPDPWDLPLGARGRIGDKATWHGDAGRFWGHLTQGGAEISMVSPEFPQKIFTCRYNSNPRCKPRAEQDWLGACLSNRCMGERWCYNAVYRA